MKRFALAVSPIALALLVAGCGSDPVQPAPVVVTPAPAPAPTVVTAPAGTVVSSAPAPAVVVAAPALRAGTGRVESVSALPPSAAAGGSSARRVGIKMSDGTVQYVDTPAQWISLGDQVELTADGQIRRN
jgi:hypothetical protein